MKVNDLHMKLASEGLEQEEMEPASPPENEGIKMIRRSVWGGLAPAFVPSITTPVRAVFFGYPQEHHAPKGKVSLGPEPSFEMAMGEVKYIQKMELRKYPDIKYNFLIAPGGYVFEGRGWNKVPTLPVRHKQMSHVAYYFMFVGGFKEKPPAEDYFETRQRLIEYGVKNKLISKKFCMVTLRHKVQSPYDPYDFENQRLNLSKY